MLTSFVAHLMDQPAWSKLTPCDITVLLDLLKRSDPRGFVHTQRIDQSTPCDLSQRTVRRSVVSITDAFPKLVSSRRRGIVTFDVEWLYTMYSTTDNHPTVNVRPTDTALLSENDASAASTDRNSLVRVKSTNQTEELMRKEDIHPDLIEESKQLLERFRKRIGSLFYEKCPRLDALYEHNTALELIELFGDYETAELFIDWVTVEPGKIFGKVYSISIVRRYITQWEVSGRQGPSAAGKARLTARKPRIKLSDITEKPDSKYGPTSAESADIPTPPTDPAANAVWQPVLTILKGKLFPQSYDAWLRPLIPCGFDSNGDIVIRAALSFTTDWVKQYYLKDIRDAFIETGFSFDVRLSVYEDPVSISSTGTNG
jgi:hypothetical protein